jgi:hypothetical protein
MVQERGISLVNPNVAYPRRGKTRKSVPDVAARRLGQVEAYLTVRRVLSEASTASDGVLSSERSDFYRFGYGTLGLYLSTVGYCCSRDDLIHSRAKKESRP